jgi:hypothetical protein
VTNAAAGFVRINALDLDDGTAGFSGYPWTGAYFTNYPVALAAPQPGFRSSNGARTACRPAPTPPSKSPCQPPPNGSRFRGRSPPVVLAPIDFQQWSKAPPTPSSIWPPFSPIPKASR